MIGYNPRTDYSYFDCEDMGSDTQTGALPVIRIFSPSDVDKVGEYMRRIIKDKYEGIDIFNLDLWRKLGADGGPIRTWLERLIFVSRKMHESLNTQSKLRFSDTMITDYSYRPEDMADYIDAYLQAKQAGYVPATIDFPWTYEPSTVSGAISDIAKQSAIPVSLLALAAVAVYGLSTTGVSQVTGHLTK